MSYQKLKTTDILADLHTHTVASKHAYSTILENATIANQRRMEFLAITDHYWGAGDDIEKKNEIARICYMGRCEETMPFHVGIIPSAEFNLGNQQIFRKERLDNLKWRLVGLHTWFEDVNAMSFDRYVELFEKAVDDGFNAFAHIEREMHKILYGFGANHLEDCVAAMKEVVDIAVRENITLEVNESTLYYNDGGAAERLAAWLPYAKEKGVRISLGTDAHFCGEVGLFPRSIALLNEVEYPHELILNCNRDQLVKLLPD